MENSPRRIKCPHCGHLTFYSKENPSRPFCSERCRLIDLGQWADGGYRIPVQDAQNEMDQEFEDDSKIPVDG